MRISGIRVFLQKGSASAQLAECLVIQRTRRCECWWEQREGVSRREAGVEVRAVLGTNPIEPVSQWREPGSHCRASCRVGADMLWLTHQKGQSGCHVENGQRGWGEGRRRKRDQCAAVLQVGDDGGWGQGGAVEKMVFWDPG